MKAYLDTSSLLKLYHSEAGSDRLQEILSQSSESSISTSNDPASSIAEEMDV